MNLMDSDVLTARTTLAPWGIKPKDIRIGWHKGEMSLIVSIDIGEYDVEEDWDAVEQMLIQAIISQTSICLPMVVQKDFKFNFKKVS